MQLNMRCIRSILIEIENAQNYSFNENQKICRSYLFIDDLLKIPSLSDYSINDIIKSLQTLFEAGYIDADIKWLGKELRHCVIYSLTYSGYSFLESILDEKRFTASQKALSSARTYSLEAFREISKGVFDAVIQAAIKRIVL